MTQRRPAVAAGRLSVHPTRRRVRGALVLQQLGNGGSTHPSRPILEGTSISTRGDHRPRCPRPRLRGRRCIVSGAEGRGGTNRAFNPPPRRTRSGSAVLDEPTGPLGGRLLAKSLGQLADLGFWVAAVPAQGLQERQLAFLGPAGHGLG